MSRSLAIFLALTGAVLFLGSCVPLGLSGYRLFTAEAVLAQPVVLGAPTRTAAFAVAPEGLVRIAFKTRIETESVQEEDKAGEKSYKPRYRFPVTLRAFDGEGKVVFEKATEMAWDRGEKMMSQEQTTSAGGVLSLQHNFDKFAAPASGQMVVEVEIAADNTYGARLTEAELLVYDRLVSETPYIAAWAGMFFGGMFLAMFATIFAITAAATPPGAASSTASPEARRYAALCHAAGLLGYVVPFGNMVGVLVAWLVWRRTDPYVDEQGKEALNFQIAVLVYVLASLLLVLVLVGFLLLFVVGLAHLVLTVVAAASAADGRPFRYPLIFRLVK
jgi:uncharacterized Tic20 family protein